MKLFLRSKGISFETSLDLDEAVSLLKKDARVSDFALKLIAEYERDFTRLSEQQVAWIFYMAAQTQQRKEVVKLGKVAAKSKDDFKRLYDSMATAQQKIARPIMRTKCGDVTLRICFAAGAKWNNAIFVNDNSGYDASDRKSFGRIDADGTFTPMRDCTRDVIAALVEVDGNIRGAMVRYGKLTGSCSICARKLTDADSVARGIGPVCENRWF